MKIFESKEDNIELVSKIVDLLENDLSLEAKMIQLKDAMVEIKLTPNGENELLTLIFEKLGGSVYFPRKGDNSERFDAIIEFEEYKVVSEVEIPSTEILDAPRNLLDDYAVLRCRRGENIKEIVPLVVCWDLPNKRTDYWNVITDINNVLGIKIKTISILCLALYYWTNSVIDFSSDDFFLNYEKSSIECINKLLIKNGLSTEDFPGYFSPYK